MARRTLIGTVISASMQKTLVVAVERLVHHARYGKTQRLATHLKARDEQQACRVGAQVQVVQTRPYSRGTHWRVVKIVRPAPADAAAKGPGSTI